MAAWRASLTRFEYTRYKRALQAKHVKRDSTLLDETTGKPLKRPLSSYARFVKETNAKLRADGRTLNLTESAKECSRIWNELTLDAKSVCTSIPSSFLPIDNMALCRRMLGRMQTRWSSGPQPRRPRSRSAKPRANQKRRRHRRRQHGYSDV